MRKRYSAQQWAAWLEEFAQSGLSVAQFCQHIDVGQNSFYFWRRKLKAQTDANEQFVPVVIQTSTQVAIEFPCRAVLRVENQVDSLRPVLQVLAELGDGQ